MYNLIFTGVLHKHQSGAILPHAAMVETVSDFCKINKWTINSVGVRQIQSDVRNV